MRVLLFVPFFDGISHMRDYTIKYIEGLTNNGVKVVLVVNYMDYNFASLPDNLKVVSLNKSYFEADDLKNRNKILWLFYRIRFNVELFLKLRELLKTEDVDIVHFLTYELVSLSFMIRFFEKRIRSKNIYFIEIAASNFDNDFSNKSFSEICWRYLMKIGLKSIDKNLNPSYTFNSKSHRALFKSQILDKRKIDESKLIFLGDSRKLKDTFKVKNSISVQTFLFFGTIRDDKGFDVLCSAIKMLSELSLNFNFIIAGKPLGYDALGVIDKFGIHHLNNVTLNVDFLDEATIDYYFREASYLVLPYNSKYKGSSGPIYEAASRGIPVIATDISEMGLLVKEYDIGYVIPTDSVDGLFQMLRQVIESYHNIDYLKKVANIRKFANEFSDENYFKRLMACYSTVVAARC